LHVALGESGEIAFLAMCHVTDDYPEPVRPNSEYYMSVWNWAHATRKTLLQAIEKLT
jgi:hypothetical protein